VCPKCGSTNLRIKRFTTCERVVVLFIRRRKYYCVDCEVKFRAPDRRMFDRERDDLSRASHYFQSH
jgi:hypothetical protein